jgi:hypothetical protein
VVVTPTRSSEILPRAGISPPSASESYPRSKLVADRGLAAVWFTPLLLTDEPTVAALRRATFPCLLVGGTADPFWNGQIARSLAAEVVEIESADHAMVVPGRLADSAAALGQVITGVEDFLDYVIWPQPSNRGRTM